MQVGDTAVWITKEIVPESARKNRVYHIYDINDVYNPDGSVKDNQHIIQLKKFMDPPRFSINEQVSVRDVFIIRLAEMYLIVGEAQFKMGNRPEAANYINIVRARAALPGHETDMEVKPSDITMDFILDGYAREFVGEHLRWFILKREKKLIERVKAGNPDTGKIYNLIIL